MAAPDFPLPPPPPDMAGGMPPAPDMANPYGGGADALPIEPLAGPPIGPDTSALLDALVQQRLMEVSGDMGMGGPPMGGPPMGGPPMGGPLPPEPGMDMGGPPLY